MVTRICGHSSKELLAIGFTKTEAVKWRKIASRYRSRKKPEPPPGPWLERYRNKVKEGWTRKSSCPDGVDRATWVRYQKYCYYCKTKNKKPLDVYSYIQKREEEKRKALLPRNKRPAKVQRIKQVPCKSDVKAIAERCREIVASKLREQGLSLPPRKG